MWCSERLKAVASGSRPAPSPLRAAASSMHQPVDSEMAAFLAGAQLDTDTAARFAQEVRVAHRCWAAHAWQGFTMATLVQFATYDDIAAVVPRIGARARSAHLHAAHTLNGCRVWGMLLELRKKLGSVV